MSSSAEPPNGEPSSFGVAVSVLVIRLLAPRGLSPKAARRWARMVVFSILFVGATVFGVLFAGGVAVTLAPERSNVLKWPGVILVGLMGWRFVHFFPEVWQNRRDDKLAVLFVGIIIALFAWTILNALIG